MSEEQDGFMLNAFGVDLGQLAQNIKEEGSAVLGQVTSTVSQAVQGVEGTVEGAIDGVTGAVTGVVKSVAGAVSGSPSAGASGGGAGSFPLSGSVGRGGKNAPNDVRAVQAALGISADGQCGGGTIAAIEAFQRNMGQANPDGRVDAGGGTERALAGGAKPPANAPAQEDDPSPSLFDRAIKGVKDLATDGEGGGSGESGENGAGGNTEGLANVDKAKLASDIVSGLSKQDDVITQLNNLDDFRETDPSPVPENTESFAGISSTVLASQIKAKESSIAALEVTHKNICKKTRASARVAEDSAKAGVNQALGGSGSFSIGAITTSGLTGAVAAGGSIGLLVVLCIGIYAEHEAFRTFRDTVRTLVNNAKLDLIIINTNIAIESKTLAAMKKAADPQPDVAIGIAPFRRPAADGPDDAVGIAPFRRPADAPVDESDK